MMHFVQQCFNVFIINFCVTFAALSICTIVEQNMVCSSVQTQNCTSVATYPQFTFDFVSLAPQYHEWPSIAYISMLSMYYQFCQMIRQRVEMSKDLMTIANKWSLGRVIPDSSSLGQHGAHLGSVGPRCTPCWPHELCYQGWPGLEQGMGFCLNQCWHIFVKDVVLLASKESVINADIYRHEDVYALE